LEKEERIIVGLNRFQSRSEDDVEIQRVTPEHEAEQRRAVAKVRAERDGAAVEKDLDEVEASARGGDNVLYPMKQAFKDYATIGEVFGRLREVWGRYQPRSEL
jgi:methylmalonyl-CoA mutase N-terminal domain/subunit